MHPIIHLKLVSVELGGASPESENHHLARFKVDDDQGNFPVAELVIRVSREVSNSELLGAAWAQATHIIKNWHKHPFPRT